MAPRGVFVGPKLTRGSLGEEESADEVGERAGRRYAPGIQARTTLATFVASLLARRRLRAGNVISAKTIEREIIENLVRRTAKKRRFHGIHKRRYPIGDADRLTGKRDNEI